MRLCSQKALVILLACVSVFLERMRLYRPLRVEDRLAITTRPSWSWVIILKRFAHICIVSSLSCELSAARACTIPVPRIRTIVSELTRFSSALAHISFVSSDTERTMHIIMRVSTTFCSTIAPAVDPSKLKLQRHLAQSRSVFSL